MAAVVLARLVELALTARVPLADDHELDAAVLRPAIFVRVISDRRARAAAKAVEPIGGRALADQVRLHRRRAARREIANAVYHATGVRIRELPMTPRTVLAALRKATRS